MPWSRLTAALALAALAPIAYATDAFYPQSFGQNAGLSIEKPAGSLTVALPADAGAALVTAQQLVAWHTSYRVGGGDMLTLDPTPDNAFDDGSPNLGYVILPLHNSSNTVQSWFVSVRGNSFDSVSSELLVGRDLNGNGLPDPNEVLCRVTAAPYDAPHCLLDLRDKTDKTLWAFEHIVAKTASAYFPLRGSVVISTADFSISEGGKAIDGTVFPDFNVLRANDAPGGVRQVDLQYAYDPNDIVNTFGHEVAGVVFNQPNHSIAGDSVWATPLTFTHMAHPPQPYALAAIYDQFDDVQVTLQPGQTYSKLFVDNPGQDEVQIALLGHGAQLITWEEPFPAPSVDSTGTVATPPPGNSVFLLDPDGLPGAPYYLSICDGCIGGNYAIGPGRQQLRISNSGTTATTVTLRVRVPRQVDFATRQFPSLTAANGNYYNPKRSGDGLFLSHFGSTQLIYWYTFDANGDPIWYVGSVSPSYDTGAVGTVNNLIYRVDKKGSGSGVRIPTAVGRFVLTRTGNSNDDLMFSWNIGTQFGTNHLVLAVRDGCATLGSTPSKVSGHWFDLNLPGWGTNLLGLGDSIAAGLYFYDNSGAPRWVFGNYTHTADSYPGVMYQAKGGACPTCAYPVGGPVLTQVGTANLAFSDDATAKFTAAVTLGGSLHGGFSAQDESIVRVTDTSACTP